MGALLVGEPSLNMVVLESALSIQNLISISDMSAKFNSNYPSIDFLREKAMKKILHLHLII